MLLQNPGMLRKQQCDRTQSNPTLETTECIHRGKYHSQREKQLVGGESRVPERHQQEGHATPQSQIVQRLGNKGQPPQIRMVNVSNGKLAAAPLQQLMESAILMGRNSDNGAGSEWYASDRVWRG